MVEMRNSTTEPRRLLREYGPTFARVILAWRAALKEGRV